MWQRLEPWQVKQLERLAQLDPDRAETVMNTLWRTSPGLLVELAISAVDQEELSISDCAALLDLSSDEIELQLIAFRKRARAIEKAVVETNGCAKGAKLAGGQITVWEIIREYRKLGSVERLTESFPGISEGDLAAAFLYAEQHPAEIEEKIAEYEGVLARRRNEYPFAT